MPYVIFSHYRGKYVSEVRNRKINYSPDIDDAKVYKTKGGAINAVGEEDPNSTRAWGKSRDLTLPTHMEIIPVIVRQGQIEETTEAEQEEDYGPDYEIKPQ